MESHTCKCVIGVNWPVTWRSNWWANPAVVHLHTLPIVGRDCSVVSAEVSKVKSSGGKGTGGQRWQTQLPRAISKGSMCMHALSREGEAVKSLPLSGRGGSLRRLPTWEKGLRSLLLGREIPEEGISLCWECKLGLRRVWQALHH